jgi:NADH-quinone oxidoreductase subunit E
MVNWEFFDNQTPESARQLVDELRAGQEVRPTRGARLCSFRETARILAGFPDERPGAVDESGSGGAPSLAGLRLSRGESLPGAPGTRIVGPRHEDTEHTGTEGDDE